MEARKIYLPEKIFEPIESFTGPVPGVNVWVSDPDEGDITFFCENIPDNYHIGGAFLYLIEEHWEDERHSYTNISGLSALRLLAHELDIGFVDVNKRMDVNAYGRGSFDHPVKKLMAMLGMPAPETRRISSLYKVRYVSNEQCYLLNGARVRVCDVLGYPLFIEAHDLDEG